MAAYKLPVQRRSRLTARLEPYWGKPAVRNLRGGGGNEVDGLMTVCHDARKGCYTGSHWPNHVRASALLDQNSGSSSASPREFSSSSGFLRISLFAVKFPRLLSFPVLCALCVLGDLSLLRWKFHFRFRVQSVFNPWLKKSWKTSVKRSCSSWCR